MHGATLLKNAAEPHTNSDGLRGLENIASYAQYGAKLIPELVEHHGFPAEQFMGKWESSKMLIDEWRLKRLRSKLCQSVSDG
jgi:hypothetical protein